MSIGANFTNQSLQRKSAVLFHKPMSDLCNLFFSITAHWLETKKFDVILVPYLPSFGSFSEFGFAI